MIRSVSVFPYSINDNSIYLIKDKKTNLLSDFGGEVDHDDRDSSVFYTASRTIMSKSGCLMWSKVTTKSEMQDILTKFAGETDPFNFFVQYYQT